MLAFKMGLKKNSSSYEDLVMTLYRKLDEVINKALRFISLKEDKMMQNKINAPNTYDNPNKKSDTSSQRFHRPRPYSKLENRRANALQDEEDDET